MLHLISNFGASIILNFGFFINIDFILKRDFLFNFIFNFSYSYVRVEEYINQEFNGSDVKIEVIKGQTVFEDMYPCLAAVNRCASVVPRHDGRVIWLTYEPEGRKPFINKTTKISLNHGVVILKNSLHCYSTYAIFF